MQNKPVALVTGANQGIGLQIANDLVGHGFTVLAVPRNLERGEAAAKEVGPDALALQLDVTDQASIAAAAERNCYETLCSAQLIADATPEKCPPIQTEATTSAFYESLNAQIHLPRSLCGSRRQSTSEAPYR